LWGYKAEKKFDVFVRFDTIPAYYGDATIAIAAHCKTSRG